MKYKLGTPSADGSVKDGEIALWVDGVNYGRWDDLWIRTTNELKINILWLQLYHHEGSHNNAGVLIDDVTVSTVRMSVELPVSTSQEIYKKDNSAKIYPNPANGYVEVKLPGYDDFSVLLYDMYGRLLISKSMTGTEANLNIENLEQGTYNVVVKDQKTSSFITSRRLVCR